MLLGLLGSILDDAMIQISDTTNIEIRTNVALLQGRHPRAPSCPCHPGGAVAVAVA